MDSRYIIKIGNKEFIQFAGLLDAAHKEKLSQVQTVILHTPTAEEPHVIVHATVTTERGVFQGIGDASPKNVGKMIAPHIIRMAETRAIARALRFATNIGMTAYDELGEQAGGGSHKEEPTAKNDLISEVKRLIPNLQLGHRQASMKKHLNITDVKDLPRCSEGALAKYVEHLKEQKTDTGNDVDIGPRVWTLDDLKGLWKDRGAGLSEDDRQQCDYDIEHPETLTEVGIRGWCEKLSGE